MRGLLRVTIWSVLSCCSKPTLSVVITSQSSVTGPRTLLSTMRPCGPAATWQPDCVVYRRGDCGMES